MQTYKLRLGSGLPSKEPVGEETDRQTDSLCCCAPADHGGSAHVTGGRRKDGTRDRENLRSVKSEKRKTGFENVSSMWRLSPSDVLGPFQVLTQASRSARPVMVCSLVSHCTGQKPGTPEVQSLPRATLAV